MWYSELIITIRFIKRAMSFKQEVFEKMQYSNTYDSHLSNRSNRSNRSNSLPPPKYYIVAEQSPENYRIVNLVRYSVIIVLSVIAALLIYAGINWLAKNVSIQFFIIRMLMMSFIPIVMGFLAVLVSKGIRSAFGRTKTVHKIIRYCFYDDHFEIISGEKVRRFGYNQLKKSYRIFDHIVLIIRGISPQYMPPQIFVSDHQMLQFEAFIEQKLK